MTNHYESPTAEPDPRPRLRPWNRCPHCGEAAMGWFTKSKMGPLKGRPCQACGEKVGVSWRWTGLSALVAIVPVAVMVAAILVDPIVFASVASGQGDDTFLERHGQTIMFGLMFAVPFSSGGLQVLVLTYWAPLIKR